MGWSDDIAKWKASVSEKTPAEIARDLGPQSKIVATSYERYNGGARVKRQYGSSTVTRFFVHFAADANDATKWEKIEAYGPTPGDRKSYAIAEFRRRRGI